MVLRVGLRLSRRPVVVLCLPLLLIWLGIAQLDCGFGSPEAQLLIFSSGYGVSLTCIRSVFVPTANLLDIYVYTPVNRKCHIKEKQNLSKSHKIRNPPLVTRGILHLTRTEANIKFNQSGSK